MGLGLVRQRASHARRSALQHAQGEESACARYLESIARLDEPSLLFGRTRCRSLVARPGSFQLSRYEQTDQRLSTSKRRCSSTYTISSSTFAFSSFAFQSQSAQQHFGSRPCSPGIDVCSLEMPQCDGWSLLTILSVERGFNSLWRNRLAMLSFRPEHYIFIATCFSPR